MESIVKFNPHDFEHLKSSVRPPVSSPRPPTSSQRAMSLNGRSNCSANIINHKCICERGKNDVCSSPKCCNDQDRHRPSWSVTTGRVDIADGSPKGTLSSRRPRTALQPKPGIRSQATHAGLGELLEKFPGIAREAKDLTNNELLNVIKRKAMSMKQDTDYWMLVLGQAELPRRYNVNSRPQNPIALNINWRMFGVKTQSFCLLQHFP